MPLQIEIIPTKTYTYFKHFLSVMVFVDLWIFASRVTHVCVTTCTLF